jgi:CRP-like cAMP-binding protein
MMEDKARTLPEEIRPGSTQRTDLLGRTIANGILLDIPDQEFRILRPHLEFVSLQAQQVVQEAGDKIAHILLLNSGLVSLLIVTSDARSVEVGMVGREGCVGGALVAGVGYSLQRALVQISGDAFRIKADTFIDLIAECPAFNEMLHRYLLLQGMQVSQLAACNRLHEVDERLARWLLMSHDRARGDSFPITHDQLAQMLGSGRPSVTVAAGSLQKVGIIEYRRGQLRVVSREELERAACECYEAIRRIREINHNGLERQHEEA